VSRRAWYDLRLHERDVRNASSDRRGQRRVVDVGAHIGPPLVNLLDVSSTTGLCGIARRTAACP